MFTENLATISLHLRWQGGKQQTTLGTKYGFRSKLNFISYQRSKSREPNLSQRSKNKATTVTEWPLCRQDSSLPSPSHSSAIFTICNFKIYLYIRGFGKFSRLEFSFPHYHVNYLQTELPRFLNLEFPS